MSVFRPKQAGFTLMEIVVATSIFATSLILILVLFTYTLKINRRVEAVRQVSQATRNFTEYLVREIRNSTIDYTGAIDSNCPASYNLNGVTANYLALLNRSGDRECFYFVQDGVGSLTGNLWLKKVPAVGTATLEQVNPTGVKLERAKFAFYVRPTTNPKPSSGTPPGVQPMVTLLMNLTVTLNGVDQPAVIPYQTTVSSDNYNIPHR
jgi:type II secretory pathway pseudopilin PulG